MTARIVGISGHARSGKDTIAERLVTAHGFVRVGWADPMKRFCQELFAFTDRQVWSGEDKERPDTRYLRRIRREGTDPALAVEVPEYLTPRYALQTIGTEWGRDCYPAIWIEYGLRVARRILDAPLAPYVYDARRGLVPAESGPETRGVVFSDCRFRNELDAVKAAGGITIRVRRPGCGGAVGVQGHASEAEQDSIPDAAFDLVITNDGTLGDLWREVDEIANAMELRDLAAAGG